VAGAAGGAEHARLEELRARRAHWNRWGPYLSLRAWGTVREDYSADGNAWAYFPHEHAHMRAYRWNEDGLLGICDRHQRICFAIALWNGRDRILKERLFGLSGDQGNHGEDVKEYYFHLDSTPTHSYMKALYKYPQAAFPYEQLIDENRRRTRDDPEYELIDTGVFAENRYFDVTVEYAKAGPDDVCIRIEATNRGPEAARLDVLPTVWLRKRNWGSGAGGQVPGTIAAMAGESGFEIDEPYYGKRWLHVLTPSGAKYFTDNESNAQVLWGSENKSAYTKDAFHRRVIDGEAGAVNPAMRGTKACLHYSFTIAPGATERIELRISDCHADAPGPLPFDERRREADEFYAGITPKALSADAAGVMRQALAGVLWSKQYYHYVVRDWLNGDPGEPPPPAQRKLGRNHEWTHLYNADVISMPDKWEYPWYASWDLAFHTIPLALVDSEFAKDQLVLLLREWYMHPNGQLPAYEWNFSDVNPPVHAWAAWRVYKIERKRRGKADRAFLERVFFKLLLNFTWWVNRKDADGRNVFQGGFLGLDNIGVFNRSEPLPGGEYIEQADGTGWMAMYCLNLMAMALELAREEPAYEDVASKFWEHFLYIANAINHIGGDGMWDAEDGFYYDAVHMPDGRHEAMKVRSIVGLIPLFAVETLEPRVLQQMPGFRKRMEWFMQHRKDLTHNVASMDVPGKGARKLLSLVDPDQLRLILKRMLDPEEFLSDFGIRSLSRAHAQHPFVLRTDGTVRTVGYEPGESRNGLFGGNSNWRGPVWFPLNYLIIESLQKFHHYLGEGFQVECPTGSGQRMHLGDVAAELSRRLSRLFLKDDSGRRPAHGATQWEDGLVLFHEFFHGDSGAGLGASHQTGWTALVAKLLQQTEPRP
jgi:Glycosyl hydrolase family 63 C-terminal domain